MSADVRRRKPLRDITGNTYGNLRVIGMVQDLEKHPNGVYFAVCECLLCGRQIRNVPSVLKRGRVVSCGCDKSFYAKMTGDNSKQFTGYKEIRGRVWNKIRVMAERRGYIFDIDIKDAWDLFEKQGMRCALTGWPIFFGKNGEKFTASLDRIRNDDGYNINNLQWVHKHINLMKNTHSVNYFVEMCKAVASHH